MIALKIDSKFEGKLTCAFQNDMRTRRVTRNPYGGGVFLELVLFGKQSSTTQERKAPQGKISSVFSCELLKIAL